MTFDVELTSVGGQCLVASDHGDHLRPRLESHAPATMIHAGTWEPFTRILERMLKWGRCLYMFMTWEFCHNLGTRHNCLIW